jgi:hypothetical protein
MVGELTGYPAGNWIVGELLEDGDSQPKRIYQVTCGKCGRVESRSERWIRNLISATKDLATKRQSGCESCREMRPAVSIGDRLGLWTVTGQGVRKSENSGVNVSYPVRCECGATGTVSASSVRFALKKRGIAGCRSCVAKIAHQKRKSQ